MCLTNKNADKICFSGTYHKVGIFLPLINAEEKEEEEKENKREFYFTALLFQILM